MTQLAEIKILAPDGAFVSDEDDHISNRDDSKRVELDEKGWRLDADEGEEKENQKKRDCRVNVPNTVVELQGFTCCFWCCCHIVERCCLVVEKKSLAS